MPFRERGFADRGGPEAVRFGTAGTGYRRFAKLGESFLKPGAGLLFGHG
jgi:hypothetical protein